MILFSLYKYLFYKIISRIDKRCVMIIGPMIEANLIATKFLMDNDQRRQLKFVLFEEHLKESDDLIDYIENSDDIIILQGLSEANKNNIVTYCLSKNYKRIYLVPKLYETNIVNSKMDQIGGYTCLRITITSFITYTTIY